MPEMYLIWPNRKALQNLSSEIDGVWTELTNPQALTDLLQGNAGNRVPLLENV